MKENSSPEYIDYFRYMLDHYSFPSKQSDKEKFYVDDIEKNQYRHLEGPVAPKRREFRDPEEAANIIEDFARSAGADLVGFTRISPETIFRGANVKGSFAISLGFQMDRDAIDTSPDPPAGIEALRAYWRIGDIVVKVSDFIRSMGYNAQGHQVRTFIKDPPTVIHPAVAVKAGLGEIGRLGFLVTKEFGPRLRLGTVTTDMNLPDRGERGFGVDDFCSNCTLCRDNCEGGAIPLEKILVRGIFKYKIDPYKCLPEFAKYDGCGICMKVCPFNRPENEMKGFLQGIANLSGP